MPRRKKSLADALFQIAFIDALLIAAAVKCPSYRPMLRGLIILASAACVLFVGLLVLQRFAARIKGKLGERIVSSRLRDGLPAKEYTVLDDIYLPKDDYGTAQIDHIVVSRYGVFVVETKAYSGWIFASADSPTWTQSIYRKKSKFQNPIRQNYSHLCAISSKLGIPMEYLRGVVAMTGDFTFKTEKPTGVVYSREAAAYIRAYNTVLLKDSEVAEIIAALRAWDASVAPELRKAHVANLHRRHG